jgi:hypothetical protein
MKKNTFIQLLVFVLVILASINVCEGQTSGKRAAVKAEKSLSGKSSGRRKAAKIVEPKKVVQAKKEQAEKKKKVQDDYNNYVKDSRERAVKIQSPAVQERMKQNQKDIEEREKSRKKASSSSTKKAARKFK